MGLFEEIIQNSLNGLEKFVISLQNKSEFEQKSKQIYKRKEEIEISSNITKKISEIIKQISEKT